MAHLLTLYNGTDGTTLDLQSNPGYMLTGYASDPGIVDMVQNSSLYTDGSLTVHSRRENAVDTYTLDVIGTSADDCIAKLRGLYILVDRARDYIEKPGQRTPSYISLKPQNSTNTSYSIIKGGFVTPPDQWLAQAWASSQIRGITLLIEREPFWRNFAPVPSTTITDWALLIDWGTFTSDFGVLNVSGNNGDLPSLCVLQIAIAPGGGNSFDRVFVGYRSSARGGSLYNAAGVQEAESGSMGQDTTATTDVTASPGGAGNTKVTCTFATNTNSVTRVTINATAGSGTYRCFARCKLTAASTGVSLAANYGTTSGSGITNNASVTVTSTTWHMIDLGIIDHPVLPGNTLKRLASTADLVIYIQAGRLVGTGSLDIDCLFLIPVDEYVLTAQHVGASLSTALYQFDNILPNAMGGASVVVGSSSLSVYQQAVTTGDLYLPLGLGGELYWMVGDAGFANVFDGVNNRIAINVYAHNRYVLARGAA